ncbi:MAG: hypothetical protein R6V45_13540 [Oceanipulchritudo sp.]
MKSFPVLFFLIFSLVGCEGTKENSSHRTVQDHEAWIDLQLRGFVAVELEPIVTEIPKSGKVLESVRNFVQVPVERNKINCEWRKYTGTLIISYGNIESFQDREIANLIAQESLESLGKLPKEIQSNPQLVRKAKVNEN